MRLSLRATSASLLSLLRHQLGRERNGRFLLEPAGVVTRDALETERNSSCEDAVVTERLLTRARAGDEPAFRELTDPHKRELQLHCYRILGSLEDAEDMLQETLLAAWRALERFEARASLRAWLYQIATNRCLNALRDSGRRPRPLEPELRFQAPAPTRHAEPLWLEPCPDVLLEGIADPAPGPDVRYETKEAVELTFLAALQQLPPRQRAVLVLRDVLGFRASEVADMLDSSEASVKGALQRARSTLGARRPAGDRERAPLPNSPRERELVGRFAEAFASADVEGVIALLTDDAWLSMPPLPLEYQGPAAIAAFLRAGFHPSRVRPQRLVPTRANTQPAFGLYHEDRHASIAHASGLIVLTLAGDRISAITRFEPSGLPRFGLPRTLRDPRT
jgi:RNA polymerase sigma-70 factor (TIGR02960 family)